MVDKETIIRGAQIELARREFFFYCNLKAPDFYKEDRQYLLDLCNGFQDFIESDDEVLIVNEPPRHGKSRTAGLLVEWVLGKDQSQKIMTGSYNETLSTMFSKNVRNDIQEVKADQNKVVFSDVFPGVQIKQGDGAMNLWSLEGGYNNYLATSPTGTATGFGASLLIIDDLIKNAEEANNELIKEKHWSWFTDTMLSRLEECGKIIIIMTRWASDDLAGRALQHFKEAGAKVRHICMKALINPETHEMLCPEVLSYKSYQGKIKAMGADIASANYQQEPIDLKGKLYTAFKTYSGALPQFKEIRNYTDTADTGDDSPTRSINGKQRISVQFDLKYFPDGEAKDFLSKCRLMQEEFSRHFHVLEGSFNVKDRSFKVTDDVLHFQFTVDYIEVLSAGETPMQELETNTNMKED